MAIKHSRPNNISVFHKLRVHIQKLILNICPSEKKILKIFYIQRLLLPYFDDILVPLYYTCTKFELFGQNASKMQILSSTLKNLIQKQRFLFNNKSYKLITF